MNKPERRLLLKSSSLTNKVRAILMMKYLKKSDTYRLKKLVIKYILTALDIEKHSFAMLRCLSGIYESSIKPKLPFTYVLLKMITLAQRALVSHPKHYPLISIIMSTKRPDNLKVIKQNFLQQKFPNLELILILHNDKFNLQQANRYFNNNPAIKIVSLESSLTLGECLNVAISKTKGKYITKMDDDDVYGPYYLLDLYYAAIRTGHKIVGKGVSFIKLEQEPHLYLRTIRASFKRTHLIAGGTLFFDSSVFDKIKFKPIPSGVDTTILNDAKKQKISVYSCDPFNYIQHRSSDITSHTWQCKPNRFIHKSIKFSAESISNLDCAIL